MAKRPIGGLEGRYLPVEAAQLFAHMFPSSTVCVIQAYRAGPGHDAGMYAVFYGEGVSRVLLDGKHLNSIVILLACDDHFQPIVIRGDLRLRAFETSLAEVALQSSIDEHDYSVLHFSGEFSSEFGCVVDGY